MRTPDVARSSGTGGGGLLITTATAPPPRPARTPSARGSRTPATSSGGSGSAERSSPPATAPWSAGSPRAPLEQLVGPGGDDALDRRGDRAVVDGVAERVGVAGDRQVGFHVDVDLERLSARLLLGERAVHASDAQAPQFDAVGGRAQATW